MSFNLPFDLEHWFISVFAGNSDLFVMIAIFAILFMAAWFRMPMVVGMASLFLFFMLFAYIGVTEIYLIFGLIILAFIAYPIIKDIIGG